MHQSTTHNNMRYYSLAAVVVMAVLCVGGAAVYKERLLFCDASYIAYNVLQYGHLLIQEGRLGSFITQGVPLLATKAGLPVSACLFLYTFSFNFFYLCTAALLHRGRQYALVVVMACYYTLIVTQTWFWTNNEIHQAIMWLFLLLGATTQYNRWPAMVYYPVFMALAIITIHTHFIVLLPLGFVWVYMWLNGDLVKRQFVVCTALLLLALLAKVLHTNGGYEQSHLHNITHLSFTDVGRALVSHTVKIFAKRSFTLYWPAFVVALLAFTSLLQNRQFKLLAWWLTCLAGYLLVMGITYDNSYGDILLFHIESEWQAIGIIIAMPFVYSWLPIAQLRKALPVLCTVFAVRLLYIGGAYATFHQRVVFLEKTRSAMRIKGIHKAMLTNKTELEKTYLQSWAITEESLVLSALHADRPLYTICATDSLTPYYQQALQQPGIQLTSFAPANGTSKGVFVIDTGRYYLWR